MKKLLIIIAVLLLAGTAFAANLNDGLTAETYAKPHGRSRVTDSSVIAEVWYTGSDVNAQIGTSGNTTIIYYLTSGATNIDTSTATGTNDTVGELVDTINNIAGWHARVGADGYRALDTVALLAQNVAGVPTANVPATIVTDCSTANYLTCGVRPVDNSTARIKSATSRVDGTGAVTVSVFDGDTRVWRQDTSRPAYNDQTSPLSSASTVEFAKWTNGKGICSSTSNGLVVRVDCATTLNASDLANPANTQENVSIVYDQLPY